MKLTIITINRNNAAGLKKTLKSVEGQNCKDFEHVLVDGASTDGSVEVIRKYAESLGNRVNWISEPDKGIYNAMNKGIGMASGEYIQILNSGDCLVSGDVTERMLSALKNADYPSILYGNLLKDMSDGKINRDKSFAGRDITFLDFYNGTLNHSSAYIRKDLFVKYGLYDESLKIVSDWKWYLQAIILGEEKPVYTDIDITLFDMNGISETNLGLRDNERSQELQRMVPQTVLSDYQTWSSSIDQMKRLKRHPLAYKLVWFLERCLFKMEKAKNRRSMTRSHK